jgi:hypothetical protein
MTRIISIDIEDHYQEGRSIIGTDQYQKVIIIRHQDKGIITQNTDTTTNIHRQDIII